MSLRNSELSVTQFNVVHIASGLNLPPDISFKAPFEMPEGLRHPLRSDRCDTVVPSSSLTEGDQGGTELAAVSNPGKIRKAVSLSSQRRWFLTCAVFNTSLRVAMLNASS